jgi:hypothetical protein
LHACCMPISVTLIDLLVICPIKCDCEHKLWSLSLCEFSITLSLNIVFRVPKCSSEYCVLKHHQFAVLITVRDQVSLRSKISGRNCCYAGKSSTFSDIMSCSRLKVNMSPSSLGLKIKPSKKAAWSRQQTMQWRQRVLPQRRLAFNGLCPRR